MNITNMRFNLIAGLILAFVATQAEAQQNLFEAGAVSAPGSTGDWHVASNWSLGTVPSKVPAGETVHVRGGRTVVISTPAESSRFVTFGKGTAGYALIQAGAVLEADWGVFAGHENGPGSVYQSGGQVINTGIIIPQSGGAAGCQWTQDGGANACGITLGADVVGSQPGIYTLNNGTLSGNQLRLGAGGSGNTFRMTGGEIDGATIYVGYTDRSTNTRMIVEGGSVTNVPDLLVGWTDAYSATLDIRGGSVHATKVRVGPIPYTYTDNQYGIEQSGGLVHIDTDLDLAENIGGICTYTQSGGTNIVGNDLWFGYNGNSTSEYVISGGELIVSNRMLMGDEAFRHTGARILHVVGMGPSIRTKEFQTKHPWNPVGEGGTLRLTLGPGGGMRPIEVEDVAELGGVLEIHGAGYVPSPGGVVTAMTFNAWDTQQFRDVLFPGTVESADVVYNDADSPMSITLENIRLVQPAATILVVGCSARGGTLNLVENGRPEASLVLAANPTRAAQLAAFELQHHVRLITGTVLPIVTDQASVPGVRILVGESARTHALGLSNADFAHQEYLIRFLPDTLILMGRDADDRGPVDYDYLTNPNAVNTWVSLYAEQGTMYAVYDFLEKHCGVTWINPTDFGTVYTPAGTLTVEVGDLRRKPAMAFRGGSAAGNVGIGAGWGDAGGYQYGGGLWSRDAVGASNYMAAAYPRLQAAYPDPTQRDGLPLRAQNLLFQYRMKAGGDNRTCNHSFETYYERFWDPASEGYHPEYFAEGYEGKPPQLCYGKPATITQVVQDARAYFEGPPPYQWGRDYFALEPMDNSSFCLGDTCTPQYEPDRDANAQTSTYWFRFVNAVAREIKQSHPGKFVSTLAYGGHAGLPTGFDVEDNVAIHFCLSANRAGGAAPQALNDQIALLEAWHAGQPNNPFYLWLYNTYPLETANSRRFYCYPGFFAQEAGRQLAYLHERGVQGIFHCGFNGEVENYVTYRMMDDPTLDVDELLDRYFAAYGAAAEPLRAWYDLAESRYMDPSLIPPGPGGKPYNGQQTVTIAWGLLGTTRHMGHLAGHIIEARAAVQTEPETMRLALFEQAVWDYMTDGKQAYRESKETWVNGATPGLIRGLHETVGSAAGDPSSADWREATSLTGWRYKPHLEISRRQLNGRLKYDDQYLYLHLVEWIGALGTPSPADHFQVILAAEDRGAEPNAAFHELLISPDGSVVGRQYDGSPNEPIEWNADANVHSEVSVDRWSVAIAVPLDAAVPGGVQPPGTFYLNLARRDASAADDAIWVPPFNDPDSVTERMVGIGLWDDLVAESPSPPDLTDLIGQWSFEDDPEAEITDSSGNGLSAPAAPTLARVPGVRGNSLYFETGSWNITLPPLVDFGNPSAVQLTDALSLEVWLRPEKDGVWLHVYEPGIFGKGYRGGAYGLHLVNLSWQRFEITTEDGNSHVHAATDMPLLEDAWNHVVATYDGNAMRVFVNGRMAGGPRAVSGKVIVSGHPLTLGTIHGAHPYVGKVDEVSLYRRALSPDEIAARWRAGLLENEEEGP